MKYKLLDYIVLIRNSPEHKLHAGDLGTVVEVYEPDGIEVEFVKASGEKIAQLALMFGADDLDGTIIEEKITRSAGALSGSAMSKAELVYLIKAAGKVPVERDSFYNPVL